MKFRHSLNKKGLWIAWMAVIMIGFAIPVNAATYTYDDLGRLTSVSTNGSSSCSYTYDAGGNVLSAVYGSTSLALISSEPLDQANNVSVGQSVYMQFSSSIEQGVNFSSISLMAGQNSISVINSVNGSGFTIDPISDLDYSTAYTLTIPAGALNEASGSASNSEITLQFTTAGSNLSMLSSDPINNDTGVPIGQTTTVTFNQNVQAGDNYNNISLTAGGCQFLLAIAYQEVF